MKVLQNELDRARFLERDKWLPAISHRLRRPVSSDSILEALVVICAIGRSFKCRCQCPHGLREPYVVDTAVLVPHLVRDRATHIGRAQHEVIPSTSATFVPRNGSEAFIEVIEKTQV
jgi:hypothetical protein